MSTIINKNGNAVNNQIESNYVQIYQNLSNDLEQGNKYLDKNTEYVINFVLKYYRNILDSSDCRNNLNLNTLDEIISPRYINSYINYDLQSECTRHIENLQRDLLVIDKSSIELIKVKKNLINLLRQILPTLYKN